MTDEVEGRDRKAFVLEGPLGPASLCGSWFMGDGLIGLVVAEPQAGVYLCAIHEMEPVEVHDWFLGPPRHQVLRKIDQMGNWQFFDSEAWLREAFNKHCKETEAS